ncbi:MAG: P-II family nitrogen regulator [Oligoflexia bacterium]|nr:P-II family nitrogen regulator [Oligoflexia bacterium]
MKLIIAYIEPERLMNVKEILYKNKIHCFSVMDSYGHSFNDKHFLEMYRGVEMEVDLAKKIRVEIAVNESYVDITIKSLLQGGKKGQLGDGKIFVLPLNECYRISTGESGEGAIG